MENETLTQVLSSEFFEIFKNTFSTKHIRATAYEHLEFLFHQSYYILFIKLIRFHLLDFAPSVLLSLLILTVMV